MQHSLFAQPVPTSDLSPVAPRDRAGVRFPWWRVERCAVQSVADDMFPAETMAVERFHSGASAYWDFRGYMLAKVPVGITATEISGGRLAVMAELVAAYTSSGHRVFVDSGAFGAFVAGRTLDFEAEVFQVFEALARVCSQADMLMLVMPDVVGDPLSTLQLQRQHAQRITSWLGQGIECVFPLHDPHDQSYRAELGALARGHAITIGVPSNLEAWSLPEVVRFCAEVQPERIHLLGLAKQQRVDAIAVGVGQVSPRTKLSCDACSLIAHAGEGRRLTDRCRSRLEDAIPWVEAGPDPAPQLPSLGSFMTDLWYTPGFLEESQVSLLAEALGQEPGVWMEASKTEGLAAVLGPLDPDEIWLDDVLRPIVAERIYRPLLRARLRGPIRALEVARLAGFVDEELEAAEVERARFVAFIRGAAQRMAGERPTVSEP